MSDVLTSPIPVDALLPRPPQITLLGSSVTPNPETNQWELDGTAYGELPKAITEELELWLDAAWVRGFAYWPQRQKRVQIRSPQDTTTNFNFANPLSTAKVIVRPWVLSADESLTAYQAQDYDLVKRAMDGLENGTPEGIEREFWGGDVATAKGWENFFLSMTGSIDVTPTPGTAVSASTGFSLLQAALAHAANANSDISFGGQGMIHMEADVVPNLLQVRRVGKLILDLPGDNIVVPGVGYTGTGPGNEAPASGKSWMYATDLVMTRMGKKVLVPESVSEALDRGQNNLPNTITYVAQRPVCAYTDQFRHFAVLVNKPSS